MSKQELQPELIQWEDRFWGDGNIGFPVLMNRMNNSFNATNELTLFLQSRQKIEMDYSQELSKIIKSVPLRSEPQETTLRHVLDRFQSTNDTFVRIHQQLNFKLQSEVLDGLQGYKDGQRRLKRDKEHEMEKVTLVLNRQYEKCERLKKDYFIKYQLMEQAIQTAAKGQAPDMTRKEYEKIQEKAIKAKKETDQAEMDYKQSVQQLDQMQDEWEKTYQKTVSEIQQSESERIQLTKKAIHNFTQIHLELYQTLLIPQLTKLQSLVETIQPNSDLNQFCIQKGTGDIRPSRIQFQKAGSVDVLSTKEKLIQTRFSMHSSSIPSIGSFTELQALPKSPVLEQSSLQQQQVSVQSMESLRSLNKEPRVQELPMPGVATNSHARSIDKLVKNVSKENLNDEEKLKNSSVEKLSLLMENLKNEKDQDAISEEFEPEETDKKMTTAEIEPSPFTQMHDIVETAKQGLTEVEVSVENKPPRKLTIGTGDELPSEELFKSDDLTKITPDSGFKSQDSTNYSHDEKEKQQQQIQQVAEPSKATE